VTFRSNRRTGFKRTSSNFSNGKHRNKGNLSQQYAKYLKLAKEAFTSGDRIQSEYYYQFTDHYYRVMVELGINLEENEQSIENKLKENKEIKLDGSEETVIEKENLEEDNIESIESIPFMAEPAKKKRVTSPK